MENKPEEGPVEIVQRIFTRLGLWSAQRALEREKGLPLSDYPDEWEEADRADRAALQRFYEQAPPQEWARRYRARMKERKAQA